MKRLELTRFPALGYGGTEAMNSLCTNLTFAGEGIRKIMITSCQASEGKSYIAMNLMRTFAKLGMQTALVDADLRRSVIKSKYGLRTATRGYKGLTHYLTGKCEMQEVVYETNIPGAYMVPVGREVANSLPLLRNPRFSRLLDELAKRFDVVLVDAPPVGVIIDAAEIAKSCDGTLFVVGYNRVRHRELQDAKEQIERTGCTILGSVLNDVTFNSLSTKKYYYKSYYNSNYAYGYYKTDSGKRDTKKIKIIKKKK